MAQMSRGQLEDVIREKAVTDPKYRESLLADPKKVLANHLSGGLPAGVEVKVVEENSKVIYLTIPPKAVQAGDELSEDDLRKVAGGGDTMGCTANAYMGAALASKVDVKL